MLRVTLGQQNIPLQQLSVVFPFQKRSIAVTLQAVAEEIRLTSCVVLQQTHTHTHMQTALVEPGCDCCKSIITATASADDCNVGVKTTLLIYLFFSKLRLKKLRLARSPRHCQGQITSLLAVCFTAFFMPCLFTVLQPAGFYGVFVDGSVSHDLSSSKPADGAVPLNLRISLRSGLVCFPCWQQRSRLDFGSRACVT